MFVDASSAMADVLHQLDVEARNVRAEQDERSARILADKAVRDARRSLVHHNFELGMGGMFALGRTHGADVLVLDAVYRLGKAYPHSEIVATFQGFDIWSKALI